MTKMNNPLYNEIEAWAQNAILNSPSWSLNQLDYSEKSISVIEVILAEMEDKSLLLSEEQITLLTQEYGCYVLMTAHKLYGGEFFWSNQYQQPMLIVGEPNSSIVFLTWNKIKGRILGDKADHVGYFFDQFKQDASDPKQDKKVMYL